MTATIESPPVTATIDAQDPLPESNWAYRRFFLFSALYILLLIKVAELQLDRPNLWTEFLILTVVVIYTIAPSAEQATKMFQVASLLRAGVTMATSASAHTPDGTTTTTASSASPAPVEPTAPVEPEAPTPPADDNLDLGPRYGDTNEPESSSR